MFQARYAEVILHIRNYAEKLPHGNCYATCIGHSMAMSANDIAAEIRTELRSILRQRDDLRKPLDWFGEVESRPPDVPRYYVLFDQDPRLVVSGLRLGGSGEISLADERIIDRVFEFAKSVWHLKDRLKLWVDAQGLNFNVEAKAAKCRALLICADLANWKKHGENRNRSEIDPRVETVKFDTSKSGGIELYYDGATKHQELLVANPVPISYRVDVLADGGNTNLGNAVDVIDRGFSDWLPMIMTLGILSADNRESEYLRQHLFPSTP